MGSPKGPAPAPHTLKYLKTAAENGAPALAAAETSSSSNRSQAALVEPYGLIGQTGSSSRTNAAPESPSTAHVEDNTNLGTLARRTAESSRVVVPTLFSQVAMGAIAGLLKDLKQRGLLDETLVVWGGEFGRQPTAEYENQTGRDHNSWGFTMWMAGGGIKGGISVGETDELGSKAVRDRFHVKNLHATILHLMGMDPNNLTYFHNGLDESLVGVEGAEPIRQVLA